MYRSHPVIAIALLALGLSIPAAGRATDIQSHTQQAQQAANAGKNTQALGLYELALTESVGHPESIFGPLVGQYWRLIVQSGDFPRALDFFTALTSEQSSPSATLLASQGSAIGGYLGWLHQNNLTAGMSQASLQRMDANARKFYNQALALEPDNFSALYGYAVYESYSPNGKAHMRQLLAKLDSLRSSHPQYPWQMVEYLQQHGHPQQ